MTEQEALSLAYAAGEELHGHPYYSGDYQLIEPAGIFTYMHFCDGRLHTISSDRKPSLRDYEEFRRERYEALGTPLSRDERSHGESRNITEAWFDGKYKHFLFYAEDPRIDATSMNYTMTVSYPVAC